MKLTEDQKLIIDYRVRMAIRMIYLKAIYQKNIPLDECFHRASILNLILIRIGEMKNVYFSGTTYTDRSIQVLVQ